MKSSRAPFHLCASPSAPTGDGFGSSCTEPCRTTTTKNLFSPFSPMDTRNQENTTSNSITPRRKLSLEMDENAQSPLSLEQDFGYCGSLGSSSATSLDENSDTSSANQSARTPLGEIKLSAFNAANINGGQRKTLLARRLMKRKNSENCSKEKDSPVIEAFKFSQPSPLLHHRPTSLPTLPLSPLTQASPSSGEVGPLTRSLHGGASKNLIKQISSPLERMSLMSPCSSVRGSFFTQRSSSVASSSHTDSVSDGYFSEVFEGEEMDDINPPLSDTLTTLINAPFANTPTSSTTTSKPKFRFGGSKENRVGPTSPLFAPPHGPGFFRSDSWCSPLSSTSSRATCQEKPSQQKRGSLKRASPCNEITQMHRTKRRPPLPFSDFSSNSQDSPPTTTVKPLKGTPLLRSQSCCMPPNAPLHSPSSPSGDDFNNIGDLSKPYALPLIPGSVPDLKCISPETVSNLLSGHYNGTITNFTIIDCRFPYEFEGGHISNALNIWKRDQLIKHFFDNPQHPSEHQRNVFVFHCEFSSKRGPQMSRFLRETDRRKNGMDFPKLYFPELYLLEGGYRAFFRDHQDMCEPRSYREMVDENHRDELRHCKLRSKSWNGDCHPRRRQPLLRNRKSVFITNENDTSNSPLSESAYARTSSASYQHLGGHK